MNRRTTRIKINATAAGGKRFTKELDLADHHPSCASFLNEFVTLPSVTRW
jgi:hypothetical protein